MVFSAHPEEVQGRGFLILLLILSTVCFGAVPLFVRLLGEADLAPATIAFARYFLTALATLPFLALGRGQRIPTLLGVVAGAAMGLGWIGYVLAIEATSIAAAGVLYMSYPLFTLLFACLLLRQRPGPRSLLAAALVVCAAWISVSGTVFQELSLRGLIIALAAPLSFGFAITILTGWLGTLPTISRIGPVALGACVGLVPVLLITPAAEVVPPLDLLPLLAAMSLFTSLLPTLLYVFAAPKLGPAMTAICGGIELPVMVAFGVLVFGEVLAGRQVVACVLVVAAVLIMSISRLPRRRPPI